MKSTKSTLVILFLAAFLIIVGWNSASANSTNSQIQGSILYVKPGADGDCLSWDTACELQAALINAIEGDQIWVAAGTYKPTANTDRTATFQLKSGVAIYGGFPADGGGWDTRDWETHLTTLSGDIGVIGESSDNSYHVLFGMWIDSLAVLDGLTISAGNANGDEYPQSYGGGIYIDSSSPILTNVIFSDNVASFGGGMYNLYSNPTLNNITFNNNSAGYGGGMDNYASNPTLSNVTFSENVATVYGGGLENTDSSSPLLINVTFSGNLANYGGGMYNSSSNPTLVNVTFLGNTVFFDGGGMLNLYSDPILTKVSFSDNIASDDYVTSVGGGMNNWFSNPTLINVTFSGNYANFVGGGMHNTGSSPTLSNVTFSDNSAGSYGGGMYNRESSNPLLFNVTLLGNAAGYGGGLYNLFNSNPTLANSILWNNSPDQIYNDDGSSTIITYSDIQGGYPGTGNIDADPLLGPLADNGGFTQTHALGVGSPAIDVANPEFCPEYDQRYYARPVDGDGNGTAICDMGSFEYGAVADGFDLSVIISGNGFVTKNPDKPGYSMGEVVTLTAVEDFGEAFVGWGGDAFGTDHSVTVTIDGHMRIKANFGLDQWALDLFVNPESSGSVTADPQKETYQYGDEVTLTAASGPEWAFAAWSGDTSGTDNPHTITIDGNTAITANFEPATYSLSVVVEPESAGTVVVEPARDIYSYGDTVTLTASAGAGWTLSNWSDGASGTDNPVSITILGDTTITANFTQNEYSLTVTVEPEGLGTVTVYPDQESYHYGDVVILTAIGNPGFVLDHWGLEELGRANPLAYTIRGDSALIATFIEHDPEILYAKENGIGECKSWEDACELRLALDKAYAGDQIWVAAGTYVPATDGNREATFQLKWEVAIYGGFPANGGAWESRNWELNHTVLSGDIGISGENWDNSFHVVTSSGVDSTTILDGFSITGGCADDYIYENISSDDHGGGLINFYSNPTLINLTFSYNSANYIGGGMYNSESSPSLTNINFASNTSGYSGGGMYNQLSNPLMENLTFEGNWAWINGGGMHNSNSNPTLINVTFSGNTVMGGGGGMHNSYSSPTLTNVTFSGNTADIGGGLSNDENSNPILTNVTFSSNSATYYGGGIFNFHNSNSTLVNGVLWGNIPDQVSNHDGGNAIINYSIIQGGYYSGTGNIDEDPRLGELADNGGFTQTHALGTGSPAIDTGDPDNCPATDQRGFPRPIDGDGDGTATCDMGAYEYGSTSPGQSLFLPLILK